MMDIEFQFYWPPTLTFEQKAETELMKYLKSNAQAETVDKLVFIFKQLNSKRFCILQFGDRPEHFLQYTYINKYLILDFPWSTQLKNRVHYRDTIELMLQSKGYHRKNSWYVESEYDRSRHYYDRLVNDQMPLMYISFGDHGEREGAMITLEIVTQIFHLTSADDVGIKFGSFE